LLFFHHVPYTYKLHSGETVIQHIYDSHYRGADQVADYVRQWSSLKGLVDEHRFELILKRLQYQESHAIVWRDAVCRWFERVSGIADVKGRVGNYPNRIEAEAMTLDGYAAIPVEPFEDASGGKAVFCPQTLQKCAATFRYHGESGDFRIIIQYFDLKNGAAKFGLKLGQTEVGSWKSDDDLPGNRIDADTSTRHVIARLHLTAGEEIRVEGIPDNQDRAAFDYMEIDPVE
ncbi:MAG TPA: hypothetical protein VMU69_06870, partial [Bradyrhizobium sp.]|nr:hypothetical protein [Bradyrhizobium sp.]